MISEHLIQRNYIVIRPWDGVKTVQPELLRHGFAAVIDNEGFWGILTIGDILEKNHRLVIDCLKPSIPYLLETDRLPFALDLMFSNNLDLLPLVSNRKFAGVVTRNHITSHYQRRSEQLNSTNEELNRINQRLKESEQKYRILVENLNEGVWQIDENSITIFVNQRMAEILGYSIEEMMGKHIFHFMDSAGQAAATKNVQDRKKGVREQHEFEFIRKNGGRIIAILESSPVFDETGNYKGAIAGVLDITERKKAEYNLQRSQKKLRAIIDNVPVVIFWKDINNKYLGCNKMFADYVGMSVDDVIGKTDHDMPWRKYQNEYIADDLKVFNSGKPILGFVERSTNHKGEETWSRTSKVPLYSPDGKEVLSVIGIFEDITEQMQKDSELQEYRNQLEQLVQERTFELQEAQRIASIGSWKYSIASDTLTWSDEVYKIFGKRKDKYTPTNQAFDACIHPDDLRITSEIFRESIKTKSSYAIEHRIITHHRNVKWVYERCEHRFDENGNHIESIGTVQDITARKKLEIELKQKDAEFELFFENINDVVLIFDIDGNTIYANRVFEKVFGKTIAEQKQNPSSFLDSVHAEDIDKFSGFILEILILHNSIADFNFEFRIHQGRDLKWLHLKGIPVTDSDEKLIRLSLLVTDITKTKQAQRDILSAMVHAEERERTRLAQDLHDGIGPLLSTTKLYLQLLSKPKSKINKESFAAQAEESIDEAISSVREISHNLSPSLLTRFGLTSAINSYIGRLRNSTNLRFTYNHNLQRPLNFEVETTIYRIVVECVNNAIRHAKASSINIEMNDNEEKILIAIADNGIGFDVEQTVKTKKGLGLVNINNRMENIGGKIEIKSAPRNGTQIKLTIPIDDNASR